MDRWESFSVYALTSQYDLFDTAMMQFTRNTAQLKNISFSFLELENTDEQSESLSIPIRLIPFNTHGPANLEPDLSRSVTPHGIIPQFES